MKKFHGISTKIALRIMGNKVIGQASKDEIENIYKKVAKTISKISTLKTEEEIYTEVIKKAKILYIEEVENRFSGIEGTTLNNKIFIDKEDADIVINKSEKELFDNNRYTTIVHEAIHKLQKQKIMYKGKEIRGFVEGATELMANRANSRNRSSKYFNFIGPYNSLTSIIAQLEVMYGKEIVEKFAFSEDMQLIDITQQLLGQEKYEELRKDMNSMARGKKGQHKFKFWQDSLLIDFFDKEIENIGNQEQAEQYLEKLKQMEKVRARIEDDSTYKEFYIKKLDLLRQKYPNIDTEKYQYRECEIYPKYYMDEIIEYMDKQVLDCLSNETLDSEGEISYEVFDKLNLDNYQRYRIILQDKEVYECLVNKEEGIIWAGYRSTDDIMSANGVKDKLGRFCFKSKTANEENGDVNITFEDGKLYINMGGVLPNTELKTQKLEQIILGYKKEDIYKRMIAMEQYDIENIFEKFVRLFKRQKMLPEYSKVFPTESDKIYNEERNIRDRLKVEEIKPIVHVEGKEREETVKREEKM